MLASGLTTRAAMELVVVTWSIASDALGVDIDSFDLFIVKVPADHTLAFGAT